MTISTRRRTCTIGSRWTHRTWLYMRMIQSMSHESVRRLRLQVSVADGSAARFSAAKLGDDCGWYPLQLAAAILSACCLCCSQRQKQIPEHAHLRGSAWALAQARHCASSDMPSSSELLILLVHTCDKRQRGAARASADVAPSPLWNECPIWRSQVYVYIENRRGTYLILGIYIYIYIFDY